MMNKLFSTLRLILICTLWVACEKNPGDPTAQSGGGSVNLNEPSIQVSVIMGQASEIKIETVDGDLVAERFNERGLYVAVDPDDYIVSATRNGYVDFRDTVTVIDKLEIVPVLFQRIEGDYGHLKFLANVDFAFVRWMDENGEVVGVTPSRATRFPAGATLTFKADLEGYSDDTQKVLVEKDSTKEVRFNLSQNPAKLEFVADAFDAGVSIQHLNAFIKNKGGADSQFDLSLKGDFSSDLRLAQSSVTLDKGDFTTIAIAINRNDKSAGPRSAWLFAQDRNVESVKDSVEIKWTVPRPLPTHLTDVQASVSDVNRDQVGPSFQVTATARFAHLKNRVPVEITRSESDRPDIANLDRNWFVWGDSSGTANITIYYTHEGVTESDVVTATNPPAELVGDEPDDWKLDFIEADVALVEGGADGEAIPAKFKATWTRGKNDSVAVIHPSFEKSTNSSVATFSQDSVRFASGFGTTNLSFSYSNRGRTRGAVFAAFRPEPNVPFVDPIYMNDLDASKGTVDRHMDGQVVTLTFWAVNSDGSRFEVIPTGSSSSRSSVASASGNVITFNRSEESVGKTDITFWYTNDEGTTVYTVVTAQQFASRLEIEGSVVWSRVIGSNHEFDVFHVDPYGRRTNVTGAAGYVLSNESVASVFAGRVTINNYTKEVGEYIDVEYAGLRSRIYVIAPKPVEQGGTTARDTVIAVSGHVLSDGRTANTEIHNGLVFGKNISAWFRHAFQNNCDGTTDVVGPNSVGAISLYFRLGTDGRLYVHLLAEYSGDMGGQRYESFTLDINGTEISRTGVSCSIVQDNPSYSGLWLRFVGDILWSDI